MSEKNDEATSGLNEREWRLIQIIRETKYGEVHIFVSDGKPVRVEQIKKSIKL